MEDAVEAPSMGKTAGVALTLLMLTSVVSVPWELHNLTMLASGENFGWGIFALFFFDAPLALVQLVLSTIISTQVKRVPMAIIVTAWAITAFTIVSAICVAAFGKASGC